MNRRRFIAGLVGVCSAGALCNLTALLLSKKEFHCLRCGKCCQPPIAKKDTWIGGKLNWTQRQELLAERKKHPPNKNNEDCEAMYFNDEGLATCLIWTMFGPELRDRNCIDYPEVECVNGQKREI